MARGKSQNRIKAMEIYLKSNGDIKNKEIAETLGVSPGLIGKWKSQDKWKEQLPKVTNGKSNGHVTGNDTVRVIVNPSDAPRMELLSEIMEESDGLTEKERLFCMYYIKNFNATLAAKKAGYSKKTAHFTGHELLKKPKISAYIRKVKELIFEDLALDINDIIKRYMQIAFADMTDFVDFGRKDIQVDVDENGDPILQEINYIDFKNAIEVDGGLICEISKGKNGMKIKLEDRQKALDKLLEIMDVTGDRAHKHWLDKERLQLEKDKITGIDKAAVESWDRLCDLLGSKFEQFKDGRGESTIQWAPFSDVHVEYIHDTFENTINVAEGAVRAGKTIDNVIAFAMGLEKSRDKIHLVSAATVGTAKLNIGVSNGFGLEALFRGRCHWGKYKDNEALYITTRDHEEKVVIFVGAGKADSFKRIRGNSYGMWLATEINIHHPDFIKEAFNRQLAAIDRRVYWDLNPEQPEHDIYTLYIDNYQAKREAGTMVGGYNYKHFTIFDNMSISDERKQEIISQYDPESIWYKRDILGQRLHVEGLIYEMDNVEWVDHEELDKSRIVLIDIAIDGGYQKSATTFSGYGYYQMPVGELPKIVVCDTYYFEPTEKEKKAPSEFSADLHKFCEDLSLMYDAAVDDQTIDSAEGALRTQYEKDYGIRLNPVAKIAKEDMIAFAFDLLKSGRVMIVRTEGNEKWYQEHRFYRWDPKKEKEPVKERDHTCDQFQYYILENMRKLGIR